MLENQQNKFVTSISHACKRCGGCCKFRGDIYLTPLNVLQISKFLELAPEQFLKKYCEFEDDFSVHLKAKNNSDKDCIFLSYTSLGLSQCAIYDVRPMACYLFPLKASHWENSFYKNEAPFCLHGKTIDPIEFVKNKVGDRYNKEFEYFASFEAVLDVLDNVNRNQAEKLYKSLYTCKSEEELIQKQFCILLGDF